MKFYEFKYPLANRQSYDFSQLQDKVVLIVNTASNCGFTYQFEGLEALYQEYKDKGLVILGFPCDQFAHQEPNSAVEAEKICKINYGVTFPIFDKVLVNGKDTTELYKFLKKQHGGLVKRIPWNFTKFLINKEGKVIQRFSPQTKPEELTSEIKRALK